MEHWGCDLRRGYARVIEERPADVSLSANQLKTLDEASRIELGFPYEFYTTDLVRGLVYGGMRDKIVV